MMEKSNYYTGNKAECFTKLIKAHEIMADINSRIDALYTSTTSVGPLNDGKPGALNPRKFERVMHEITQLEEMIQSLLKKRAIFDIFVCSLAPMYQRVLYMRCGENRAWKEIAAEFDASRDTVERIFKRICEQADDTGLFD